MARSKKSRDFASKPRKKKTNNCLEIYNQKRKEERLRKFEALTVQNDNEAIPIQPMPSALTPTKSAPSVIIQNNVETNQIPCERTPADFLNTTDDGTPEDEWSGINFLDTPLPAFGHQTIDSSIVCETVGAHALNKEENTFDPEGKKRICDLGFFTKQIFKLEHHDTVLKCGMSYLKIVGEKCYGFQSCITFFCEMCNRKFKVWTDPPALKVDQNKSHGHEINKVAVVSALCSGISYEMLYEFLSGMNLATLSQTSFYKIQDDLDEKICSLALDDMLQAGREERAIAVAKDNFVTLDNGKRVPFTSVKVDGSWQRRSYRGNYASLMGTALITGVETGKVLFMAIRSKYCATCLYEQRIRYATDANEENIDAVKSHKCYKNWGSNQSSGSMEASIIAEGFSKSVEMHGLVYKTMIADGDSNTMKALVTERPYGNSVVIQKIECKNHMWRAFNGHIRDLVTISKKDHPVTLRKIIGGRILKLRKKINKYVESRNESGDSKEIRSFALKNDILVSVNCIFNNHALCETNKDAICDDKDKEDKNNFAAELKATPLWENILKPLRRLINNSRSLIENVDTNSVECSNSVLAKYTLNKSKLLPRSYMARLSIAVITLNRKGNAHSTIIRGIFNKTPGSRTKCMILKRLQRNRPKERRKKIKRKLFKNNKEAEKHYGRKAQTVPLQGVDLVNACNAFMASLQMTDEEIVKFERSTILQSNSELWVQKRRLLLTASNHGKVCKRRKTTLCKNLVYSILYSNLTGLKCIDYGNAHEGVAKKLLSKELNVEIEDVGLFLCKEHPEFGASPDGRIDKDTIVEIKCPYSARDKAPEAAIIDGTIDSIVAEKNLEVGKRKGSKKHLYNFSINKNHDYYFQIQSQLHYTNAKICIFCVYTNVAPFIKYINVPRDELFYKDFMEPKLVQFYSDCLLPEIVDPMCRDSYQKNDIREPQYLLDADAEKREQAALKKAAKNKT